MKLREPDHSTSFTEVDDHPITIVIAMVSALITVLLDQWKSPDTTSTTQDSTGTCRVTHEPASQDTGSTHTTCTKSSKVKSQPPSTSTTSGKSMAVQKKEDGGTKPVRQSKKTEPTVSSVRRTASKDVSSLPKSTDSTYNRELIRPKALSRSTQRSVTISQKNTLEKGLIITD